MFATARVPLVVKLGSAALAGLAIARPAEGLLVLAAALPFSYVLTTRVWSVFPLALSEALVLAWLAAHLVRALTTSAPRTEACDRLTPPAWLFAIVVSSSCAVQVALLQAWHDYPLAYLRTFIAYLGRHYLTTVPDIRPWVDGRAFVSTAALLLESVALALAARTVCRRHAGLDTRLLWTVAMAGAGAALINLGSFIWGTAVGDPEAAVAASAAEVRWTAFIPSLNTSGAYFLLVLFPAIGLVVSSRTQRVAGVAAGIAATLIVAAMWVTKTYAAIVAAIVTAAAGLVWVLVVRTRLLTLRRAAAAALAVAAAVGLGTVAVNPLGLLADRAYLSLHLRALFAETAIRMWAAFPWFGVGVGQYGLHFQTFSSAELLRYYSRADAHNYLLWVAAELGLVGLASFLWLLGAVLTEIWQRLRTNPSDPRFVGLSAGLAAFAVTWLGGQPLSVPNVAYTFWILVGAATHRNQLRNSGPAGWPAWRSSAWPRILVVAAIAFVVASVPVRIRRAVAEVDFGRVTYGFYGWEDEGLDIRYRWTGPRATLFVPVSVRAVEVPLRTGFQPSRLGLEAVVVRVLADRRRAGLVFLRDDRWHRVRVPKPTTGSGGRFWRIDLEVTPTWRPADYLPGSTDRRVLGVKVGEVKFMP